MSDPPQKTDSMDQNRNKTKKSNVNSDAVQSKSRRRNSNSTKMSTLSRPKSPRTPTSGKNFDKEESFWDKIGTLGRKKRIKEGEFMVAEILFSVGRNTT